MKINELWEHLLSKFRGDDKSPENDTDTDPEAGQAVELVAEEAPEPVPERKTSDEVIIRMADSTLEEDGRMMPPAQERAEEQPEAPSVQDGEDCAETPAPGSEDCAETPAPEFDDWAEEAVPEYEDETDGIREE